MPLASRPTTPRPSRLRRTGVRAAALVLATGAALALSACQQGAAPAATSAPTPAAASGSTGLGSGAVAANVTVSSNVGQEPTVQVGDLSALGNQVDRKIVVPGSGPAIGAASTLILSMAVYDGGTGQASVPYQSFGKPIDTADSSIPAFFGEIFEGVPSGSRIVAVIPASIAAQGQQVPEGTAPTIIVADVQTLDRTSAWGAPVAPTQSLVQVADGAGGAPKITIAPDAQAPADVVVDVIKQGDGAVVGQAANVVVQYSGVLFPSGQPFDSSWTRGAPAQFNTAQVVPGFKQAIEGQKVGSQVIAIVPPAAGYGEKGSGQAIPPNSTLVFVIDILAIA